MRQHPNEEILFRITNLEIMNLKNDRLMSSIDVLKNIFTDRYPTKELVENSPIRVDPDVINGDAVLVSVVAREKA